MVVGALLCRNEAAPDRYLERVIKNAHSFCDSIVVVDDGSIDGTSHFCRNLACDVTERQGAGFWVNDEAPVRAQLWELAIEEAGEDGWIYFFDADHELLGLTKQDFQTLCRAQHANAWAFPLWDCWNSDTKHRVDGFWQAWKTPRPWLVRAVPHKGYCASWNRSGLHVGHIPSNYPMSAAEAPCGAAIRHLSYVRESHRVRKAQRYLSRYIPTI